MRHRHCYLTIFSGVFLIFVLVAPASALVMCKKRSGVISLRDLCKPTETQVDSADLMEALPCPPDSARVGSICVDKYEAMAVEIPLASTELIAKVQEGVATWDDIVAGGGIPKGGCAGQPNSFGSNFPVDGQWTSAGGTSVYAVSLPAVWPTNCISWFQAAQACALSGKRLLTNMEWQMAAAGTPDPEDSPDGGECNTAGFGSMDVTGNRPYCKSNWGVYDMVGNLSEMVAEWETPSGYAFNWNEFTSGADFPIGVADYFRFRGDAGIGADYPVAFVRGGAWDWGSWGGVLSAYAGDVFSLVPVTHSQMRDLSQVGFRCGR